MRSIRIQKLGSSVTRGLLPTQQQTISQVVGSFILCHCLTFAEIACCFHSKTSLCHNLKRSARFVSNHGINSDQSKEVVTHRMINQLQHRLQIKPNQPLGIIIDWISVHPFQVLSALIPVEGRAVPMTRWVIEKAKLKAYQNICEIIDCLTSAVCASILQSYRLRRSRFSSDRVLKISKAARQIPRQVAGLSSESGSVFQAIECHLSQDKVLPHESSAHLSPH